MGEPWQGSPALLLMFLPPPPPPAASAELCLCLGLVHQRSVALQPDSCLRTSY